MKMAVLHVNSATYPSLSPTMRIARFMAETLNIPLMHSLDSARAQDHKVFDVLFVKYGVLKFSDHREQAVRIHNAAKRVIELQNDYVLAHDKRFKPADNRWGTVQYDVGVKGDKYINWNMVSWEHGLKPQPVEFKGLFYHGAFRPGREQYFRRYFDTKLYQIVVSSFRGGPKFREINPNIITGVLSNDRLLCSLAHAQLALYIEDEYSHTHYTSPATRFYECLHRGTPMVFDVSCYRTFQKAGIDIDPWVVRGPKDVKAMLLRSEEIRAAQRKAWYRNYITVLRRQVLAAARTL